MTDLDLSTYTDEQLADLAKVVNDERQQRARINEAPARLAEIFDAYKACGGNPDTLAAEAQRLADHQPAPAEVPAPTKERTP